MKIIEIHSEIYRYKSVMRAISAYNGLAKIKLVKNDNYYVLEFDQCKYDEDRTIKEFENYLIGVENT